MKNMRKKGFTITELVIVIAVIAILAAVLIPTFTGLVGKAKESVALQESRAALNAVISDDDIAAEIEEGGVCYIVYNDGETVKWYKYESNQMVEEKTTPTVDETDIIYTEDGEEDYLQAVTANSKTTVIKELADLTENVEVLIKLA